MLICGYIDSSRWWRWWWRWHVVEEVKKWIKMATLLMEQNSIILVNKYSLSWLLTSLLVSSILLVLKKVTSRETKFWQMYSIEYSTRNQQQNTEWWHIEWMIRVINYKQTIEKKRESYNTNILLLFLLSFIRIFFFFFLFFLFILLSLIVELLRFIFFIFHPVSHRYILTTLSWSTYSNIWGALIRIPMVPAVVTAKNTYSCNRSITIATYFQSSRIWVYSSSFLRCSAMNSTASVAL